MLQAQNAHIQFQTKKRSFDLAWGSWAGILAVMTALGAALIGSQILLMRLQPVDWIVFNYPSLSRANQVSSTQLSKDTLTIFFGAQGVLLGRMKDVVAPQDAGRVLFSGGEANNLSQIASEIKVWMKENEKEPVRFVALGESALRKSALSLSEWAGIVSVIEQLNQELFSVALRPTLVPVELANSR